MRNHFKGVHVDEEHTCEFCDRVFRTRRNYLNHKSFMHFKGSYGTKKPNAPKRTVTFETESEQEWVESNPSDVDKPKNGKKTIIKNEQAIKTEPISPQEMEVY